MSTSNAPDLNAALLGRWEPVYRSRLHYLVRWATRARKPVLKPRHAAKLTELLPRLCEDRHVTLVELATGPDHVHLLLALRPAQSVASVVRDLKGRSGVTLLSDHPELRVWLGANLLWEDRYSVETVSPIRLERVRERLRVLHPPHDRLAEAS
jgi:putative transposase